MVKVIYGRNVIEGVLEGFTPGSSEMEIKLHGGLMVQIPATTEEHYRLLNSMRVAMTNIGLHKLMNSTIDFNSGKIDIQETKGVVPNQPQKGRNIKSTLISK